MDQEHAPVDPAVIERFWKHVSKCTGCGCWRWTGRTDKTGYPLFILSPGVQTSASRFAWELQNGPIDESVVLVHKVVCPVRCCVNPDHIEPVGRGSSTLHRRRRAERESEIKTLAEERRARLHVKLFPVPADADEAQAQFGPPNYQLGLLRKMAESTMLLASQLAEVQKTVAGMNRFDEVLHRLGALELCVDSALSAQACARVQPEPEDSSPGPAQTLTAALHAACGVAPSSAEEMALLESLFDCALEREGSTAGATTMLMGWISAFAELVAAGEIEPTVAAFAERFRSG